MATAEQLAPLPAATFPVVLEGPRTASRQGLVSWHGNQYSVPPELAGARVTVVHRLGSRHPEIATADRTAIARHLRAENSLGATTRDTGHVVTFNAAALTAANTSRLPRRKECIISPGPEAQAAAAVLRGGTDPRPAATEA